MVCYDRTIFENLESECAKNQNIEKIYFKVVQCIVLLAIATNIPQRLKTGFVVQGHKC